MDLSTALVIANADQSMLTVTAASGDTEMLDNLSAIGPGIYVVGSQGTGFLRRVITSTDLGNDTYLLETENARLEEVISLGTGYLDIQLTQADLEPDPPPQQSMSYGGQTVRGLAGGSLVPPSPGVTTADGVRFVPSDDLMETTFHFVLGGEDGKDAPLLGGSDGLVFTDPDTGATASITGTLEVQFRLDTLVEFGWRGLHSFRFVPVVEATESLNVEISGELSLDKDDWSKQIADLQFSSITFFIGLVPVVVIPSLKACIGLEADAAGSITAGIEYTQVAEGGILWTENDGLEYIRDFRHGHTLTPITVQAQANVKGTLRPDVSLQLYGVMGPTLTSEGYIRLRGESSATFNFD